MNATLLESSDDIRPTSGPRFRAPSWLREPLLHFVLLGAVLFGVDHALASNAAVYGLTTQVGHGKDTRLNEEEVRREQMFLVMSHSGGIGSPLPTPQVRAALAVRLNGIARGGSGASADAADALVAMLNAGVHPIVPEIGSVGAADIGPMAGMAQVAVGMGQAEYRGEVLQHFVGDVR